MLSQIIHIAQLLISILLIISILLQQRGAGGSAIMGGGGSASYYSKRGFEKILFIATIILSIFFILTALLSIIIKWVSKMKINIFIFERTQIIQSIVR